MSYNIDTWRTKEINDLRVPLASLHDLPRTTVELHHEGISAHGLSEGFELHGSLDGAMVRVTAITSYGEASGSTFPTLMALLKLSTGTLIAVQVWEGGDSITRLTVRDGVIMKEQIEL